MEKFLIEITQNGMGRGNEELGVILIKNYLKLINEEDKRPRFITFYNEGVKLICKGSPTIEELKALADNGVIMLACKTCLKYFNLTNQMEVGTQGSMMDIIELQKISEKIIHL